MLPDFREHLVPCPALPVRRSALLLHSLCREDREWILARLPDADGAALTGLLAELQALGIPADPGLIDSALHAPDAPQDLGAADVSDVPDMPDADRAAAGRHRESTPMELLGNLSDVQQSALIACLQDEPRGVAAVLLALQPWPWRQAVAAQLAQTLANAPPAPWCSAGAAARLGPALAQAVLGRMESRMAQQMADPETPTWAGRLFAARLVSIAALPGRALALPRLAVAMVSMATNTVFISAYAHWTKARERR